MHHVGAPAVEAGLAIGQVQAPDADEGLVKTSLRTSPIAARKPDASDAASRRNPCQTNDSSVPKPAFLPRCESALATAACRQGKMNC